MTTDVTGKLTKERSGNSIGKGVLSRHISGQATPAANLEKLGKIGCTLDMTKGVELAAQINEDTLIDNQDNPNFEKEQYDGFNTTFSNDLLFLGITGTADNTAIDAPFAELAKGWITVAKESNSTVKIISSNISQIERLKHVVSNMHEDIRGRASIVVSAVDYDSYQLEIAEKHQNTAVLLKADARSFMGYPIEVLNDVPAGTYLTTLLKNLIFGIATQVKRRRWFDNDLSALKYRFVVYPDYEFDIHKYVTLSEFAPLTVTSYSAAVNTGATVQRTVQSAAGLGIAQVSVSSKDEAIATTSYQSATGVISITGVAVGSVDVVVSDGTSEKVIAVTVTAP